MTANEWRNLHKLREQMNERARILTSYPAWTEIVDWIYVTDEKPPLNTLVYLYTEDEEEPIIGYREIDAHTLGFPNEMYLSEDNELIIDVVSWARIPVEVEDE